MRSVNDGEPLEILMEHTAAGFHQKDQISGISRPKLSILKVNKFQNENMKSSHFPKSERKNLKNSVLNT